MPLLNNFRVARFNSRPEMSEVRPQINTSTEGQSLLSFVLKDHRGVFRMSYFEIFEKCGIIVEQSQKFAKTVAGVAKTSSVTFKTYGSLHNTGSVQLSSCSFKKTQEARLSGVKN